MLCEVMKEIPVAGDERLKVGTKVDSDSFRLGRQLISQRYLKPIFGPQDDPTLDYGDPSDVRKVRKGKR